MRIANVRGRLPLLETGSEIDVEEASSGRFSSDPHAVFAQWDAFRSWAPGATGGPVVPIGDGEIGPPSPRPAQVFGIGLNYAAHAAEAGLPVPDKLPVFTKFPTCLAGPPTAAIGTADRTMSRAHPRAYGIETPAAAARFSGVLTV